MGLFDMIKNLHSGSRLYGFLNGPHGIFSNNYMEITKDYMDLFRNTGGFDMIRKCILQNGPLHFFECLAAIRLNLAVFELLPWSKMYLTLFV